MYGNNNSVDYRTIAGALPVDRVAALLCPPLHGKSTGTERCSQSKALDAHGMGGTVAHGIGRFIPNSFTGLSRVRTRHRHRQLRNIHSQTSAAVACGSCRLNQRGSVVRVRPHHTFTMKTMIQKSLLLVTMLGGPSFIA